MNGFPGDAQRYNPANPARPQSSKQLNLNDSIQVHLLVETALGDSQEFEILSEDEVDDLKREIKTLKQRIEQTRQNLLIQSKYRDAAISMSKLYLPEKKKSFDGSKVRGILGHNRNSSEHAQEANQERSAAEKKCEDLATELWFLERRIMEPQSTLLKHTAGILQMTHKGPKLTSKGPSGVSQNGIPGSPESMYTYTNARNSFEPLPEDDLIFDERSLYRSFDRLDGFSDTSGSSSKASKEQMQMIAKTEQKLEDLNSRLREVIVQANPQQQAMLGMPPLSKTNNSGKPTEPGETLEESLRYLEHGISTIGKEQSEFLSQNNISEAAMEQTIEELNRDLHSVLQVYDTALQGPPQLTGRDINNQLDYFQNSVNVVEAELNRSANLASKGNGNQEQMEAVMMGLWDIILSGEQEARERKSERRQNRLKNNLPPDEDESDDDEGNPNEQFSTQAFSTKVQFLYAQATKLKDQKKVLQRQIKQQRELNNKSDAVKDADITRKTEELERMQDLLRRTEMDSDQVRQQLTLVMEKLDESRQQDQLRDQSRSKDESEAVRAAQRELDAANTSLMAMEEELQELKDDQAISNAETQTRINESEARIVTLTQQLTAAAAAQTSFEKAAKDRESEISTKEKEMEAMNMDLARLQTEVTIARAELDGAYGSRAQRAADIAANPAIQKEFDDLTRKNNSLAEELAALKARGTANPETDEKMRTLKRELEETIGEYEEMTKASIEWEKEREQLEGTVDKLRDEREQLEAQLSDEKVRWLGMRSPGMDGQMPAPGTTSTTVLKNEFKKMMRDTRAENAKALRVCCFFLNLYDLY
ncbi:hypothetical protein M7I_7449 [Glarea lozoyensis 74030]|uniref:Ubiquitin-like domain-containing protein n=1 Tax=Glarea lozoyensis (strain ATCC 74030 / MF5533) TaxID=1104152 RepID=H0EXB5_GLAL7|nr:hypothetical protein M7I_7449 [Glarea lozoyensis 74030]